MKDLVSIKIEIGQQLSFIRHNIEELDIQYSRIELAEYPSRQKPYLKSFRKTLRKLIHTVEELQRNASLLGYDDVLNWIDTNKPALLNILKVSNSPTGILTLKEEIAGLKQERKKLDQIIESIPMLPGGIALMPGQYEAFKIIRGLMNSVKDRFYLVDPWVNETIFDEYLDALPIHIQIKILTRNFDSKFLTRAKKFKTKNSKFEVKKSDEIHDRYMIIDDRAWILGPSIKDIGKKAYVIVEFINVLSIEKLFETLWVQATLLM
jgi:hypothetical protein